MKNVLTTILLLLLLQVCHAQISGIINDYTKVTGVDYACNAMEVSTVTGFSVGDTVLIIQMQGATVNGGNSTSFGNITAYNDAGNYEFAHIYAIQNDTFYFNNTILRTYDPAGSVQIVRVPQYNNVTIVDTLKAQPWDGNVGGVLVFEATGIVSFNAPINVSAVGFRGGEVSANGGSCWYGTAAYYYGHPTTSGGQKGEGISQYIAGRDAGRAYQANGGGGGGDHNHGGGGGGNYGPGGRGGEESSSCGFSTTAWAYGAVGLNHSNAQNKVFLGGGGGGGHQNNFLGAGAPTQPGGNRGGNGGGMAIIIAGAINGNNDSIISRGEAPPRSWGDGAGGGGGGGTVILETANYLSPLNVDVSGGRGGHAYDETGRNMGAGGGGGGGALWVSTPTLDPGLSFVSNAGPNGVTYGYVIEPNCGGTSTSIATGCSHGAVSGAVGGTVTSLSIPESPTPFGSPCVTTPVELLSFKATNNKGMVRLIWQTVWEQNNDYFILEGSKDAKAYTKVAKVDGNGSVNTISNYSYNHYNSGTGVYYYRLKQVDYDGTTKVVGIRSVVLEGSGIKVYPNPFNDYLTIQSPFAETDYSVQVYGLTEELHKEIHITNSSGEDQLAFAGLTNGFYLLKIISGDQVFFEKVLKQ